MGRCHMYLRDLADSLLRRWILVVVAVMMTGGACFLASQVVGPTYRAEASIVLVPPKSVAEPAANRFLELGSLTPAVDVLTRALNADATREAVHDSAPEGTYEATVDDATSAPVLVVTAEAPSAAQAQKLADAVVTQAPASLSSLQSALSIARGAEITSISLPRDEPQMSQKSRLRAVAALGVLCLAGSAVLIGAVDGMLLVRAARKELRRQEEETEHGTAHVTDDEHDAWLENELATITSGVEDVRPVTGKTSRTRE
jgi:capsular polysaccharide biosynthesis protein